MKKNILHQFYHYITTLCQCNYIIIISTLGGCDGLVRTDFGQLALWGRCGVLKGLIFNNFHFGRLFCVERDWFFTIYSLGGCDILKGVILDNFYFERVWSWQDSFWTVTTLEWCDGLQRSKFVRFNFGRVWCSHRTDLWQFPLCEVWWWS